MPIEGEILRPALEEYFYLTHGANENPNSHQTLTGYFDKCIEIYMASLNIIRSNKDTTA